MEAIDDILDGSMEGAVLLEVQSILAETIRAPVGPEFMAPPTRMEG
jgi:hypothetical protein